MSTTTISDRIAVTRHPDGALTVNGYAPKPLYTDRPHGKTYESEVFHGYYHTNGWANGMWDNGHGGYAHMAGVQVPTDRAEQFLTTLADLAVRANGGAA